MASGGWLPPPCPPRREQKGGGDAARRNGLRPSEWVRLPCPPGVAPRPRRDAPKAPPTSRTRRGFWKGELAPPLHPLPARGERDVSSVLRVLVLAPAGLVVHGHEV